ncbi:C4b-binding protein alpha chain-like [Rousettus aegyptiacus]|uniref:C4b-binding protein alpha chain-like n=1 Tax=Rousettus aegyptiacus TaxID=9407 RepID=UPI00168D57A2|nr:C4b-binding protein alpha chain-like [Rousettus aegyptiacus]
MGPGSADRMLKVRVRPRMPRCTGMLLGPLLRAWGYLRRIRCANACDDPPRFESMMLSSVPKNLYVPGDKIEYQCHHGYEPILSYLTATAVCQPDSTWTPLQEACTKLEIFLLGKSCPQLEEPLNGQIIYVYRTFRFGSQAHYVCNEGFHLLGTKILYCELSGSNVDWSDNPPECEKIICRAPGYIVNGKYTNSHKATFNYNEVVTYSCNPSMGPDKYSLVGESKLTCRGVWSSDPPECKVVKCQDPVVENGRMVSGFGGKYYYKAQVAFECNHGFRLKGNSTIFCGANNVWEPEMPECIKGTCGDPPRFESMMLYGLPKTLYHPGDKIEYQCRPGYKRILPFLATFAVCQPDNTWTPLQDACAKTLCPFLGDPPNGQIIYVNRTFQFGSQAHYVCNEGYYLRGTKILYCKRSGDSVDWSDNPPQCEKIFCQRPGEIFNGKYTKSYKATFDYNEVVTYSCNPSEGPDKYSLVGESRLACSGHDVWSSDPPQCKVVKCQNPVVKNGRLVSGFRKEYDYKAKVVFECLEGFKLKGNGTIFCGANNVWEPEMPECIKDACDDPPRFESMMLKGTPKPVYHPGDKIEYQCRLGYKHILPFLATSAVCQPDKTWTHLQEACTKILCPQLGELQNGQIIYSHGTFQLGSQAHYICNEGYYLLGTKVLYCEHSGDHVDWSDNPPQCEKILCQPPGEIPNGKYTNSHKATFEYNEVVTYSCNPSKGPDEYSLVGESRLACSGHNVWNSDPPQCKGNNISMYFLLIHK